MKAFYRNNHLYAVEVMDLNMVFVCRMGTVDKEAVLQFPSMHRNRKLAMMIIDEQQKGEVVK